MALPLPFNTQGLPVVNAIMQGAGPYVSGPNSSAIALVGAATFTGAWTDVSMFNEIRLQSISDVASAVGGVHIDWSLDGVTQHATEAAGSALAATLYDSGPVPRRMQYMRVRYVNGAAPQTTFLLRTQLFFSATDCRTREYLDEGNVPPLALLATATYTGAWTQFGPYNKLNLVGSIDQAGTLFIDQSRNGGATTATTEQWAGAIGEAFAFPTERGVGCNAYRLRFTAGGVNLTALVLAPYLTVGEVDHDAPISVQLSAALPNGNIQAWAVPVGSRSWTISTRQTANPELAASGVRAYSSGASGSAWSWDAKYSNQIHLPLNPGNDALTSNNSGAAIDAQAWFYA